MIITDEAILRIPCVNAEPHEIVSIIEQLDKELALSPIKGIGLAAPQINIHKNIAIVRINDTLKINLVNCRIANKYDLEIFDGEGCLSFPGEYVKTMRYQEIHVVDNAVYPYSFIATGLFAVSIQHEVDHLSGRLLVDFSLSSPQKSTDKVRPNDLCPCNSGKKYKRCCKLNINSK